uniref:Apolipoprotein Ba n=1 Tax=Lepisosteus oculatus TaxID=7918 RepID=W5NKW1_LEPOC|nr:PREDICTED: apolipoprotein B-100 [Lepisosteus oculatus]
MGDPKLSLLLLLITYAFAQQDNESTDEQSPTCLLSTRFKNLKKYVYRYEAESQNGVTGTANLRNGPRITCMVELEVPRTCNFIMRTTDCTLSEVKLIDPQGRLVYSQSPSAAAFKSAMEKNILMFQIEHGTKVTLFPKSEEPTNILNIKRGIISALMAPADNEQQNEDMQTLHGQCRSVVTANSATDVTVTRDLSECDRFHPKQDYTSPLALISGMHIPLSNLISSSQTCNYQFDPKRKHVTGATCIEKYIFLPFSHKNEHGISSHVKQTLTLKDSTKINNRIFEPSESNAFPRSLFMEHSDDKSPVQSKDAVLTILRDLSNLPKTQQRQQRASLFQKLVTELRALKNETLGAMVKEMGEISSMITMQALPQCGTPECTSAMLQVLRTSDSSGIAVDAAVYALGLLSSPCSKRVREMLSMAQHRQSRATLYGLSSSVKKFYQNEGKVTPEVTEVAEFMAFMLGSDCSGDEDQTYLTLRAIGNMGGAMEAASPKLKSTILKCVKHKSTTPAVQQAAIQAFRQMTITDEVRSILLQTLQDMSGSVQKRVAAYLMLMRNPSPSDLNKLTRILVKEKNEQVRNFIASHITNILDSKEPSVQGLREKIIALKSFEVPVVEGSRKFSRNYKISSSMPLQEEPLEASMQGNMIFDPSGYMPREVMLETTLKAFGYNIDMFEVGLEGNGFEPTIDALFGEKGFFPDSAMKAMYWAENKMPDKVNEVLKNWVAPLKSEKVKREIPVDIVKEVSRNFNRLMKDLKSQKSPEAMAYLRIMETELGYIKASDLKYVVQMAETLATSISTVPSKIAKSLLSGTDNEIFAHYIFMDNEFSLPTSTGFPLKFSLSGVFAPGAKGGLKMTPEMKELSFMPSVGVEFVTHMGVHIPEFNTAGVEMHTNIYHESAFNAKLTMKGNQVKLSIPAPQGPTQLFSISNKLLSVSSTQTEIVPPLVESRTDSVTCRPLLTGLQYCTTVRYSNASSTDSAPYYPLTGETRFALEVQPTGEVTEYSATVGYEVAREGRQKIDTVKIILQAEGSQSSEASVTLKYNRNKMTMSSDLQIPDYDIETGIKLGVNTEAMVKGKKTYVLTVDVTNKKVPELSLVGHARLEGMKDGLLQGQLTIPSLKIDAITTATIKSSGGLTVQLDSSVKIPESSSVQRATFRYDDNKVEIELKSDVNSEVTKFLPDPEQYQKYLNKYVDDILEQKVAKTDMKLRHIVSKSIEAGNIWLDKMAKDFPYIENHWIKRNIPENILFSFPEKLYMKSDSLFRYQFNKDKFTINVPLPFGGKTSEDLNFPKTMYSPPLVLPKLGINIPTREFNIPSFSIPQTYELSVPLLGVAELSTRLQSNLYNWTASVSGGNQTTDTHNFIAKYQVMAECPVELLSYKIEGTGLIHVNSDEMFRYTVKGSLQHKLLDASFSWSEAGTLNENLNARAIYTFDASSILGIKSSLIYSSELTGTFDEFKTDAIVNGSIRLGPLYSNAWYTVTYVINPRNYEANGESWLKLDTSFLQAQNRIKGSYANEVLSITSNTNAHNDALKHIGELSYKDGNLLLKSDAAARYLSKTLRNTMELALSSQAATIRAESQAEYYRNRVYALVSGSLNGRGLEINTDGSINVETGRGSHKATLSITQDGLSTSGTTTLQCIPLTFENNFNGGIGRSGASLTLSAKGDILQERVELNVDSKLGLSEAYLNTIYKINILNVNAVNRMNLKINNKGLDFSNNMIGSYEKMKTEQMHSLRITLWTLAFRSKTDNFICPENSYKHDIKFEMEPFIVSLDLSNNLKLLAADINNVGQLKVKPYQMKLSGSIRGVMGNEELRHNYEISYADLTGIAKYHTIGNIKEAKITHHADIEVAGLSAKFSSEASLKSKSLQFESSIRSLAMPFTLSVDSLVNANGELDFYGKHSGQLFSKFLMKAEPLAFTYSHDYRGSTTHQLDSKTPVETLLENKLVGLLTPSGQSGNWKLKTKLNENVYNHDMQAYNNAEMIGVELSGQVLTDYFRKLTDSSRLSRDVSNQVEEFSISGFLKYDKNKDMHIIQLPFVESLPALIEQIKDTLVVTLESLQNFLRSLDINDFIRKHKARLDKLPQQVNDYMKTMDLENKVAEAKRKVVAFTKEYTVSLEDLEGALDRLRELNEKALVELQKQFNSILSNLKNAYEKANVEEFIADVLRYILNELEAIDKKYEITKTALKTVRGMEEIIQKYDLKKLKESGAAWLQDLDSRYEIKAQIQKQLNDLKSQIQSFDLQKFGDTLTDKMKSINIQESLNKLKANIPTEEIAKVLDAVRDLILNWIEDYEITEKINSAYATLKELLVKYEVDKKVYVLMDQAVLLTKRYKIKETVQSAVNTLKSIDVTAYTDKALQKLDDTIGQLKELDYKEVINQLNQYIDFLLQKLKSFNYNEFVDDANKKISEMTKYINDQIQAFEIPQKIEALQQYIRGIQGAAVSYLEQLRDTKVAEVLKWIQDLVDSTALSEFKKRVQDNLMDLRQRISTMDIKKEIQLYLQRASEFYTNMVKYITDQWSKVYQEINNLAVQYDAKEIVDTLNEALENGYVFPEYRIGTIRIPSFELSLRALRKAEFETPEFTVPLTNLEVPSVKINLKKLQEIRIPTRFTTPEITILNEFTIPSITIDFNEIKRGIISVVDRIRNFEIQLPDPDIYFRDLKIAYLSDLPDLTFPEITLSEIRFPEFSIPKLNLENFEMSMLQIPEYKLPRIPHEVSVPTFGKLSGEFKIKSPFYNLVTTAEFQNATSNQKNPQFTASVISQATSTVEYLAYTLDITARLSSQRMRTLQLSETVKLNHNAFSLNHQGDLIFSGSSVQGTSKTTGKASTEIYTAELVNNIRVSLESGVSASMDTTYNHNMNIPAADISSQATVAQNVNTRLESGTVSVTVRNTGSAKWSIQDYVDDGTHKSDLQFSINVNTAKLTFTAETNSKALKMKQNIEAESVIFSHATLDIRAETETPFIKSSVLLVNGKAHVSDMKIELVATHDSDLTGRISGTIANSINFLAHPFEIVLNSKNKGNMKISFPLKLIGKIELFNGYALTLNSGVQQVSWQAGARFNQYKYSHNFTLGNNENDIGVYATMNGEANLDFLNVPITTPEIPVPYTSIKIPSVKEMSLWEKSGLKELLRTTRQSFDLNFKVQYQKNLDMHAFSIDLEPIYKTINDNIKLLNQNFEYGRDNAVILLTNSYNKAKEQYEKFKIDTSINKLPRTFRIPGYTVPILNIEVSPFTAELPAFSFVIPKEVSTPSFRVPMVGFSVPTYTLVLPSLELPVLHVPSTLRKLTLPKFKLPSMQNNILIPAMGNITYDFSLKSTVITLNANAGLYNQTDIVARFGASSTSVFEVLKFKFDGTTSLTRKRGLKLATALSLEHVNIEGSHDSTVSLTKKSMDASVTTNAKVSLPVLNMEFSQELLGNSKSKPNVASNIKLKYNFNLPLIETTGKGTVEQNIALEGLTSYFSMETSTKGKIDGSTVKNHKFSGTISNEANVYLNANGLRSTMKTDANSKVDAKRIRVWNFELNENSALEASPRRVYAMFNYTSNNEAVAKLFNTKGRQTAKATLDLVPSMLTADLQIDVSQPSSLSEQASIFESLALSISSEKQQFTWSGKRQISSNILGNDLLLSNDEPEVRLDVSGSLQGHVSFLKQVILPVYDKSLWDVLKFDVTTNEENLQFLNSSTSIVYTKNKDGYFFPLPVQALTDGVTINIPEITLAVPEWVKNLPQKIQEIDIPIENFNIPDKVSIPSVINTPAFNVPLTTLRVPSYTIDFKKIEIPKRIRTLPFDLTLPHLPNVKFPKLNIGTDYLNKVKSKLPHFSVKVPEFDITISSFTLPKTFTVGTNTIHLDSIVNKISNFDLPTITIPEQKIEIPELSLSLPAGVFIPYFGALSATVKVASPIYNVSWTTSLENKSPSLVSSVRSSCSSTLVFLEYDLEGSATATYQDGALSLNGKSSFSHSDLSIDMKHEYTQNQRMKREASPDGRGTHHTLNVDITSPAFADVSLRYTGRNDEITASISSTSAGFLGLLLEKKSPELLHGRLYSRYPSSPEKDVNILDTEVSLRNHEMLHFQATWNGNIFYEMLTGLREKVPKMMSAVYKCIDKYHRNLFGVEISVCAQNLRKAVSNVIETSYRELPKTFEQIGDETKKLYKRAADSLGSADLQNLSSKFYDSTKNVLRQYQKKVKELLDAAIKFLKETKFQLPGFEERFTGHELYLQATQSVIYMIDQIIQQVDDFMERYTSALVNYIKSIEFKVPGTDQTVSGKEVLKKIKIGLRAIQNKAIETMKSLQKVSLEKILQELRDFLQTCSQKVEEIISTLKSQNFEEIRTKIGEIYSDAMNSPTAEKIKDDLTYILKSAVHIYRLSEDMLNIIVKHLEKASLYVKSLREEYLDANMVGWTVRYYEIEEKIIDLIKRFFVYVKEVKEIIDTNGSEYFNYVDDLVFNVEGKGQEMVSYLVNRAQDQMRELSTSAKRAANEYKDLAKVQIQNAFDKMSLDNLSSEIQKIIDFMIQKYSSIYNDILNLLQELSRNMRPYMQVSDSELNVNVPLPFLWESFDELPERRDQ